MKRLARVALLVLLGAIITFGVSWACARLPEGREWTVWESQPMARKWPGPVPKGWPARPTRMDPALYPQIPGTTIKYRLGILSCATRSGAVLYEDSYTRKYFGLPFPSMRCDTLESMDIAAYPGWWQSPVPGWRGGLVRWRAITVNGQAISVDMVRDSLPLVPHPLGFAANALVFAIIASAAVRLFASIATSRRRARSRAGLCAACGYPLGVSEICTECGRPVRRARELVA